MQEFHEDVVAEVGTVLPVESIGSRFLVHRRGDGPALLLSACSASGETDAAELYEELWIGDAERAEIDVENWLFLFGGRLWRRLAIELNPDDASELIEALENPPGASERTIAPDLVIAVRPGEVENPLSIWISSEQGGTERPVGFLGGETRPRFVPVELREDGGQPLEGPVTLSAHTVPEGTVRWVLPVARGAGALDQGTQASEPTD